MIDDELVAIFRQEADERLGHMADLLLACEGGSGDRAVVDGLFRDAHSIKGAAGMIGFGEVQRIAHAIEDVMEGARERGLLHGGLVDALLGATDAIGSAIAGQEGVADVVLARLAADVNRTNGAPIVESAPDPAPVQPLEPTPAALHFPAGAASRPDRRTTIRVGAERVDGLLDAVGEAVLHHRQLTHALAAGREGDPAPAEALDRNGVLLDELQHAVLELRTLPLSSITGPFRRAVRDVARGQEKDAELVFSGLETRLDRVLLDGISEMIGHLLRNAVAHGIEPPDERVRAGKPPVGRVELRADQRGDRVAIEVSDDGRGVSEKVLALAGPTGSLTDVLARPGFSTAENVTDAAGRGVGLDAVKTHVEGLSGSLEVSSEPGRGTRVVLLMPLTLALLRVLLVERAGTVFAFPLTSVHEARQPDVLLRLGGRPALEVRGEAVPVVDLAALGLAATPLPDHAPAVVIVAASRRVAVTCDRLIGEQEIVVKPLGPLLSALPAYLGAAVMQDGRVALVLDPSSAVRTLLAPRAGAPAAVAGHAPRRRILVVDDQFMARELQRSILEAAGHEVATACDGLEALDALQRDPGIGLVVSDIQMPRMDGLELLHAIRADPERASLAVLLVTSLGSDADRRLGAAAGADAYIVKQEFDQQALLEQVDGLLGR